AALRWPTQAPVHGKALVTDPSRLTPLDYTPGVQAFFDQQYPKHERYWWREENRYNTDRQPTRRTTPICSLLHIRNELRETVTLAATSYDLVIMNGCLHYVCDKNLSSSERSHPRFRSARP